MSHLAHIVTFKKTLIADGITDPKLQIELTRSAYVRALIALKCKANIDNKDYKNFCKECGYIEFGIKKFTEQLQKEFKFEHRTGRGIYFAISTIAFDSDNAKDAPSKKKEML